MNNDRLRRIINLVQLGAARLCSYRTSEYNNRVWEYFDSVQDNYASDGDFTGVDPDEQSIKKTLADADKDLYLFSRYTGGSDYAGSTVERSNYLVLTEDYSEFVDHVINVSGGHGTYDVCFSVRWLISEYDKDDDNEYLTNELIESFEGLGDYPLLDEDHLSHLEMESANEAWDNWAAYDFARAIEKHFESDGWDIDLDDFHGIDSDDKWYVASSLKDACFRTFFEHCRESVNCYWECEGYGHDMYVDVDRVAEYAIEHYYEELSKYVPSRPIRVFRDNEVYALGTYHMGSLRSTLSLYQDIFDALEDSDTESITIDGSTFRYEFSD